MVSPAPAPIADAPARAAANGRWWPSIPIADDRRGAAAPRACAACLHGSQGPLCRTAIGEDCTAPRLSGPAAELQVLLQALGTGLGFDAAAPDGRLIQSLRVEPGEIELVLAVGRHCGGALLADTAFQTLRRLRPDTDIYVLHAA